MGSRSKTCLAHPILQTISSASRLESWCSQGIEGLPAELVVHCGPLVRLPRVEAASMGASQQAMSGSKRRRRRRWRQSPALVPHCWPAVSSLIQGWQ